MYVYQRIDAMYVRGSRVLCERRISKRARRSFLVRSRLARDEHIACTRWITCSYERKAAARRYIREHEAREGTKGTRGGGGFLWRVSVASTSILSCLPLHPTSQDLNDSTILLCLLFSFPHVDSTSSNIFCTRTPCLHDGRQHSPRTDFN